MSASNLRLALVTALCAVVAAAMISSALSGPAAAPSPPPAPLPASHASHPAPVFSVIPSGRSAAGEWYRGALTATVRIDLYSDYGCVRCAELHQGLAASSFDQWFLANGEARLVQHLRGWASDPAGLAAAEIAGCAGRQERFWEVHDALMTRREWLAAPDPAAAARELALGRGLEAGRLDACLRDGGERQRILAGSDAPQDDPQRLPLALVNGSRVIWAGDPVAAMIATVNDYCQAPPLR